MKKLALTIAIAIASAVMSSSAFAADTHWGERPNWFKSMLLHGEKGNQPVTFTGKAAKAAICKIAPTFTVGGIVHQCGDAYGLKFAASGCYGTYVVKRDGRGYNIVKCTRAAYPVALLGVTYVDAAGNLIEN